MCASSQATSCDDVMVPTVSSGCGRRPGRVRRHAAGSDDIVRTGSACRLCSSAHVRDDVQRGESMFLAEARRMASLAQAVGEHQRTFVVLDEPFRGTNVHDATEVTQAVVQRLVARARDTVFVAYHLTEMAPALGAHPSVALLQFEADCTSGVPVFDYRARAGVSMQRLGMYLLQREGVLRLLDRALPAPGDG